MCGFIVLCMAAVMCGVWNNWLGWSQSNAPIILSKPSNYSQNLQLQIISWILEDKINLGA